MFGLNQQSEILLEIISSQFNSAPKKNPGPRLTAPDVIVQWWLWWALQPAAYKVALVPLRLPTAQCCTTPSPWYSTFMSVHHIAAMLFPAWGHTISYIHLALQMLNQDPHLVITLFQHNNLGTLGQLAPGSLSPELLACFKWRKWRLSCRPPNMKLIGCEL